MSALLERLKPTRVLLAVAALEVGIDRIAVPMTRPELGDPPTWHVAFAYVGLFLYYFAGVLAAVVIGLRCATAFRARDEHGAPRWSQIGVHACLGVAGLLAAVPLVAYEPQILGVLTEIAFAIAIGALIASTFQGRTADAGIQIGIVIISLPLFLHVFAALGDFFLWPEHTFDGPGIGIAALGVIMLALGALATPYCFAPRPFARSVMRLPPVALALAFAASAAMVSKMFYAAVAKAAMLAIGVELTWNQLDARLVLYLLAVSTLIWTLASCATASSQLRKNVGTGLSLVVLGGFSFKFPENYLLPLVGLAMIAEAGRGVRAEEAADIAAAAAAVRIAPVAPPIADATWAGYVASVVQGLRRTLDSVHSLTSRGDEDGATATTIVGALRGRAVRVRIERALGCVLSLDVIVGRELSEVRTTSLFVQQAGEREVAGGPVSPIVRAGDAAFDERFRCRGSDAALQLLLPSAELRARATAVLDGTLAFWATEGLRYWVQPGRAAAPLDHPMPLSDLALGKSMGGDELVNVIELLAELGDRVLPIAA